MDLLRRNDDKIESLLLCGCSGPVSTDIGSISARIHQLNRLADLFYCTKCVSIRCKNCLTPDLVAKYCPRCFNVAKPDARHCPKNCFSCPKCLTSLLIKLEDVKDPDTGMLRGKQFKFRCPLDHYSYDSPLIEKPRSLPRIMKSIMAEEVAQFKLFDDLKDHYLKSREIAKFHEKRALLLKNPAYTEDIGELSTLSSPGVAVLSNLELAKLSVLGNIPEFEPLHDDLVSDQQLLSEIVAKKDDVTDLEAGEQLRVQTDDAEVCKYPVPEPLKAKYNLFCKKCNENVVRSDPEPKSSRFNSHELAIDVIPKVDVTPLVGMTFLGNHCNLLMHFSNPSRQEYHISVSTFDSIPLTNDSKSDKDVPFVKVNIPCSSFTLGKRPENNSKLDSIITTIPTVYLKGETPLSRAELMKRTDVLKRLKTPLVNNTSSKPLDSGVNWCSIALNLEFFGSLEKVSQLRIPFFVSIKSESFNLGYWIVSGIEGV